MRQLASAIGFALYTAFIGPTAGTERPTAHVTEIAPGEYVRVGLCAEAEAGNADAIATVGFIIGRQSVAVIDPGGSLADGLSLRAAIRAVTHLPIRTVVMTHAHPDHVFGGQAFLQDHPVFVGHWRLPGALSVRADYDRSRLEGILGRASTGEPVTPTMLVHDTASIDLGGRVLQLRAMGIAHSDTDLVVFDSATRTLWAGDLLFDGRVPSLEGNLVGWLRALDELVKLPATRAVPGHGPSSLPWPEGAANERRYLTLLLHDVRAGIAAGHDISAVAVEAAAAERGKWLLFDSYAGHNATIAYKELQWE